MAWLSSLAGGVGGAIGGAAAGIGKAAASVGGAIGKGASAFHQGVGQGTGLWGGQPGTQSLGQAMVKTPGGRVQSSVPYRGWEGVNNQLGQMAGQYISSQSPMDFGSSKSSSKSARSTKSAEQMLEELAGRR